MSYKVGDIMQVNVRSVPPFMTLPALERELIDAKVGGFPVVENGKLVGVVSRSDVVKQLSLEHDLAETVSDFYFDDSGFHELVAKSYAEISARVGERIDSLKVVDVMVRTLHTASPDWSLEQLGRLLTDQHIHRVPVTDDERLMGIVTTMDLARLFAERRVQVVE